MEPLSLGPLLFLKGKSKDRHGVKPEGSPSACIDKPIGDPSITAFLSSHYFV